MAGNLPVLRPQLASQRMVRPPALATHRQGVVLSLVLVALFGCEWLGVGARRHGSKKSGRTAGRTDAPSSAQVPQAGAAAVSELQLLRGQALFELQRWGEAVLVLRRAAAPPTTPTVAERAERYLGVARQALTHTMFDSLAHCACQPPLVPRLTDGEGFRRPFPLPPALHAMLQRHIAAAVGPADGAEPADADAAAVRDRIRELPVEKFKSIISTGHDGAPQTRVMFLSPEQKQQVVSSLQPVVESWVGQRLLPSSVYGVRLCLLQTTNVSFRSIPLITGMDLRYVLV